MSSGKFMINDIHAPATARETKWTFQDHGVNTTLWVTTMLPNKITFCYRGRRRKSFSIIMTTMKFGSPYAA